jgi:hypothetical protein
MAGFGVSGVEAPGSIPADIPCRPKGFCVWSDAWSKEPSDVVGSPFLPNKAKKNRSFFWSKVVPSFGTRRQNCDVYHSPPFNTKV